MIENYFFFFIRLLNICSGDVKFVFLSDNREIVRQEYGGSVKPC